MGKMLYSATMSLDGFMAGPGGDMSWLTEHLGPNPEVDDVIGKIGALLVGNRTFRGDDPYKGTTKEGKPFGGEWDRPQFVLTHHTPDTAVPGVTFVSDLDSGAAAAKAAAGDKYVNILGSVSPVSASTRARSTRSSCSSRLSCSATGSGCSTSRAGPTSGLSGLA